MLPIRSPQNMSIGAITVRRAGGERLREGRVDVAGVEHDRTARAAESGRRGRDPARGSRPPASACELPILTSACMMRPRARACATTRWHRTPSCRTRSPRPRLHNRYGVSEYTRLELPSHPFVPPLSLIQQRNHVLYHDWRNGRLHKSSRPGLAWDERMAVRFRPGTLRIDSRTTLPGCLVRVKSESACFI